MGRKARQKLRRDPVARQTGGRLAALRPVLVPVCLIGLVAAAYVNADHEEFFFDSAGSFIENPRVFKVGQAFGKLFRSPLAADEQLCHFTFALNYRLNRALGLRGFDVTTFLAFNALIHAINACLVYALLRSILGWLQPDRPPPMALPLALAALFAVHPLHGSTVAYIAQRRGAMATTFFLLAVLTWLRVRRPQPWTAKRLPLTVCLPLCQWLSYRSKSLGLTLPLVILMVEFCLRAPDRAALRRYLRWFVPGVALAACGLLFFLWQQGLLDVQNLRILPYGPKDLHGAWVHLLTESRVFLHYWKLLLLPLPRRMSIDHDFALSHTLLEHGAILALLFHGSLTVLAVAAARKGLTLAAIGILWFYFTLLPYAVLPQAELMVEYKTYLPSIGLTLVLAEVFYRPWPRIGPVAKPAAAAVAGLLLLGATITRNKVYRSPVDLWADAVAKYPNFQRPHSNLAAALVKEKRIDEAIWHFKEAIRLLPSCHPAYAGLGVALAEQGNLEQAIECYNLALRLKPDYVEAHVTLGIALSKLGRVEEANQHYQQALKEQPTCFEAHNNLAINLARQGKLAEAVEHFRAGLEINPESVEGHFNLGLTLERQEAWPEAIEHYRFTLKLEPKHWQAHFKLAEALFALGRLDEAIVHYREVVRINPDFALGRQSLERALSLQAARGADEAVRRPTSRDLERSRR